MQIRHFIQHYESEYRLEVFKPDMSLLATIEKARLFTDTLRRKGRGKPETWPVANTHRRIEGAIDEKNAAAVRDYLTDPSKVAVYFRWHNADPPEEGEAKIVLVSPVFSINRTTPGEAHPEPAK